MTKTREQKPGERATVHALLDTHGQTYAAEAGIRLRGTPQPLYQLLLLADLLSARIRASVAVATARALADAGLRDPRRMADASWQQRVDALGEGGYRRYDERTDPARRRGRAAARPLRRRPAPDAPVGDVERLRALLQEVPGLGPTGADIFLREVQRVWPEFAPYLDAKALRGAERLGLSGRPERLARLVPTEVHGGAGRGPGTGRARRLGRGRGAGARGGVAVRWREGRLGVLVPVGGR